MVHLDKSGTDQRTPIRKLTYIIRPPDVISVILSLNLSHHFHILTKTTPTMPKAHRKSNVDEEDDVPLHGATNEEEAKVYSNALDGIVCQMGVSVKDEKVDAIKEAMKRYKDIIANMFPNMAAANTEAVFASVKDKVGLCLCPQTEQKERLLESLISAEEVTSAAEVLEKVEDITPDERA